MVQQETICTLGYVDLLLVLQGNAGVDSLAVAQLDGGGRQEQQRFPPG